MESNASSEVDETGIPNESNFYLPSFNDYGQSFFEREGLRFRAGPIYFNVTLSLGAEYNDNVYATYLNPTPDMITRVSPYFQLGLGDFKDKVNDYLLLDYRPSYDYYLSNSDLNRLNQTLDLEGRATFSRYTTAMVLNYINSDAPSATQDNRQGYQILNLNWNNSYYLTEKTFARLTLDAIEQSYENSDQYTTYSASPLLGYIFSPKTTVFMGPYAGIAYIGSSEDSGVSGTQTFQGFILGLNYTNLRKLKFQGTLGIQGRQFHGINTSGATDFTTPVFDFALTYNPQEKTDLSIELIRNVQISDIVQGLAYTNSEVRFGIRHRLTSHVTLSLDLDYQNLEYQGLSPEGRADQFLLATPSISYSFWRDQCMVNVYYRRQQRTSTLESFSYTINTYGVQFIFHF